MFTVIKFKVAILNSSKEILSFIIFLNMAHATHITEQSNRDLMRTFSIIVKLEKLSNQWHHTLKIVVKGNQNSIANN